MTAPAQQRPICNLCGNYAEQSAPVYSTDGGIRTVRRVECRTCGTYVVSLVMDAVAETFDRVARFRLSGITRTASEDGRIIEITTDSARALLNETPELGPIEQEDLILEYLDKHSRPPGKAVPLDRTKDYPLAHALGPEAFQFVVNGLASADLIHRTDKSALPHYHVTRKGYEHLSDKRRRDSGGQGDSGTDFQQLTDQQQTLITSLAIACTAPTYHAEFVATATFGKGWFVVMSPIDAAMPSREITGFEETDLHALRDRGYVTLLHKGSFYVGSLTRKGQETSRYSSAEGTQTVEPTPSPALPERPNTVPALVVGSTFDRRYEIVGELGHGGMGVIYKAHDKQLDEIVALKTLSEAVLKDPNYLGRFWAEIKLARKVSHPLVCRIYECGEHNGIAYFTMELIEGRTLKQHISQHGPLSAQEAISLGIEIAEGLQALHDQGIIHRDLKSSNVMRDGKGHIRLMDFGIAKDTDPSATQTASDVLVGSFEYMSPEYLQTHKVDPRSDVYSFGILLYELLVGRPPFQGQPAHVIAQHLKSLPPLDTPQAASTPAGLKALIARCLAKMPDQRYATASELAAALKGLDASPATTVTLARSGRSTVADAQMRRSLRRSVLIALYEAEAFGAKYVIVDEIATAEARRLGAPDQEGIAAFQYFVERRWAEYKGSGPTGRLTVDGIDEAERVVLDPYGS
jgi:hypothetical protein